MTPFADEARRCRAAHQLWTARPIRNRLIVLKELRFLLVDRMDALCDAVAADVQRDAGEVAATDLLPAAAAAKYLVQNAASVLAPRRILGSPLWLKDCVETIHRRPHGVVAVIGTWNYPVYLTLGAILPALAAGNGVLWKPSENTPRTAEYLQTLLLDAGVPEDVVVKLPGDRDAGPRLCDSAIDYLHFTGSEAVGRRIAARLGERLIPSTLELSGCDALIVMPNADDNLAARVAWYGATLNNGQTCIASRRAFVPRGRLGEFVAKLEPLVAGSPPLPLVTPGQREQYRRLLDAVRAQGIRVISPHDVAGASILIDPPATTPACVEASFAPVLSVLAYDGDAELMRKIEASPFGLSSTIMSTDGPSADALAAKLRTGSAIVNDAIVPTANPATPFGGRGASGWGVTGGAEGLLAMTVPQVVSRRRGRFRPHVDAALNRDPAATVMLKGLFRFSHARRWGERWSGFLQMVAGFRKRKV